VCVFLMGKHEPNVVTLLKLMCKPSVVELKVTTECVPPVGNGTVTIKHSYTCTVVYLQLLWGSRGTTEHISSIGHDGVTIIYK